MRVLERPELSTLNTFGIAARARLRIDIENEEDVIALPGLNPELDVVLGGGSNVLLIGDVPGTVYCNRIMGKSVVERTGDHVIVEVGAGEPWHDFVAWTLEQGFCGLENLSLIPGNAGAAPMQNIGAYGVELASAVDTVTAWDWQAQRWRIFARRDCAFGYRDSRFKSVEPDRFLITSVRLALSSNFEPKLDYPGLAGELNTQTPQEITARDVSNAVIRIRRRKLPDPAVEGNAGSFFKNPLVPVEIAEKLRRKFGDVPSWPATSGSAKLSAAWLIEAAGLKGHREGAAAVSDRHALVLVNRGGADGSDIWRLACLVRDTVKDRFGVDLEPEPRVYRFN